MSTLAKADDKVQRVVSFFKRENIFRLLKSGVARLIPSRNDITLELNVGGDSMTNGDKIWVGLPEYMLDCTEEEIFSALKAILAHEAQHVNSSDFEAYKAYQEKIGKYFASKLPHLNPRIVKKRGVQIAQYFGNGTEDGRIEKILGNNRRGYVKHLKFFRGKWWDAQPVQGKFELGDFLFSIVTIATMGIKPKGFNDFYKGTELEANLDKVEFLVYRGVNARTARECLLLCEEMIYAVEPYLLKLVENMSAQEQALIDLMEMIQEYTTSEEKEYNSGTSMPVHFKKPQKKNEDKKDDKKEDQKDEKSSDKNEGGENEQSQDSGESKEDSKEKKEGSGKSSKEKQSDKQEEQKSKEKSSKEKSDDEQSQEGDPQSNAAEENSNEKDEEKENGSSEKNQDETANDENKQDGNGGSESSENEEEDGESKGEGKSGEQDNEQMDENQDGSEAGSSGSGEDEDSDDESDETSTSGNAGDESDEDESDNESSNNSGSGEDGEEDESDSGEGEGSDGEDADDSDDKSEGSSKGNSNTDSDQKDQGDDSEGDSSINDSSKDESSNSDDNKGDESADADSKDGDNGESKDEKATDNDKPSVERPTPSEKDNQDHKETEQPGGHEPGKEGFDKVDSDIEQTADEDLVKQQMDDLVSEIKEESAKAISESVQDPKKKEKDSDPDAEFRLTPEEIKDIRDQYKEDTYSTYRERRGFPLRHALKPELKREAAKFRKEMENIFKNKEALTLRGQKRGVLDPTQLHRFGMKDYNVFVKKGVPITTDYVGYLLQDGSGSMEEERKQYHSAYGVAVAEEGLKGLIPFKVVTYSVEGENSRPRSESNADLHKWYNSFGVTHHVVKDFSENSKTHNHAYNFIHHRTADGGNKDGFSIRMATKELLKRPEKDRLLIIFSDGLPTEYRGGERHGMQDVKDAVKEARAKGIFVVSIIFGTENFRKANMPKYEFMYEKNIISCSPKDISSQLSKLLKKVLSR